MKANFMKKTCAWLMTTVTVATAIVPNTVNVAFAADVEPDTNTSMQIDDADVSADTNIAPVEDATPAEDNTTVNEPAVEEPTPTTEEQPTVAPTEDASTSTDEGANKDANVPSEETPSEDATVTKAPKTSSVRFSVPKKGGKVVVNTNTEGSQPVDVLTNEKDYSYKLENVEVGTVISTDVQCDNGYDVASYHVLKDTGKGMVELLEANEVDRVDLEKLKDFVASCTTYKHNITVGEDPIVVEVVFEETKKDENAATDETKKDDSDAAKDVTTEETTDETKKDLQVTLGDGAEEHHAFLDKEEGIYNEGDSVIVTVGDYANNIEKGSYALAVTPTNDEDKGNLDSIVLDGEDGTFGFTMPAYPVTVVVTFVENDPNNIEKIYDADDIYLSLNEDFDQNSLLENERIAQIVEFRQAELKEAVVESCDVDTAVLGDYEAYVVVTTKGNSKFKIRFRIHVVEDKDAVDAEGQHNITWFIDDDNHANYTIDDNGHSNGKYNAGEQVTFTVSPMEGYMITDVSAATEGEDGEEGSDIELTRVSDNSDSSDSNISTGDIEIPVADDSDSDVAVQSVGKETENVEDSTDERDVNSNEESYASSNSDAVVPQEETDDTSIDYSNADIEPVTYTFTMPDNDVRIVIFTESTVAPLYNPKIEGKIKKYKVVYASDIMAHYKSEYSGGKEASTFYRTAYGVNAKGKKVAGSDAECYCVIAGLSAPEGFVDSGQSNFEELKDGMLVSRALFYMNPGYGVTYPWIDNKGKESGSTTMKARIGTKGTGFYNTNTENKAYNLYATKHFILSMLYGFARSKGDHDISKWSEADNIFNAIAAHYYPNKNTGFWTEAGRLQLTKMAYVMYNIAGNASCDVTYDGDDGVGKGHVGSRNSKKNVLVSAKTIKLTSDTSKNFYYLAGKSNTATITAPDGVHIYVNNVDCGNSVKIDGRTSFYLKSANTGVQTITINPESNIAFSAYRINNFDKGYQDLAFIGKGEGSDFYAQIEFEGKGSVKLTKSSANATITKDNPCYSLADAKYDVFSDYAMKNKVGTLTTVADGTTNTLSDLAPGTYYAKETQASKGYKLCGDKHTVTVEANKTATFTCAEEPLDDPGLVRLLKKDSLDAGNDLSGAEYTISYYANTDCNISGKPMKQWVMKTVKVNTYGTLNLALKENIVSGDYYANGDRLLYPIGTYTIQETKAPNNYLIDNTVYVAECKQDGNSASFTFKNTGTDNVISKNDATGEIIHKETPKQYGIKIKKVDNDTQKNKPQGNATLKDATFDIIYTGDDTVGFENDATKHFKKGDVVTTIKTDENGVAQTSANALYAGTYQVVETGSPYGYDITDKVLNATFDGKTDKEGTYKDFTVDVKDVFDEHVVRAGVQITKQDAELNKSEAMAGTDLEGISFTITNKSKNSVVVDGKEYAVDEVVKTIKSHKNDDGSYSAETEKDTLPVGTYEIHEVESNKYYFTDGKAVTFEIKEADKNSLKSADVENNKIVFNNQVVRADINLVKINEDHDRMSVPFVIENTVSHEKHVIVTDTNGEFNSTKSAKSKNTNVNDKLLDGYVDGKTVIPQSSIVYNSGLWFGTGEYGTLAKPNDTLGSLPHGKYTITELRCESNRGYKLVKATFDVAKDTREQTIDLGTFTNRELPPQIKTVALDSKTKDHLSYAGTDCTVIDTVSLSDLVVGKEYTLKASFIDYSDEGTGLKANGRLIKGETTFTSTDTNMSVEVKLNMDASKLKNMTGVVYESLYKDGKVIASHESIEDADQTIHFPEIGTKAVDTATDDEVGVSGKEVNVKDTVEYKNLIPGKEYTVKGTLYNKADEKAVSNEVSVNFTPSSANGTVDVVFTFTNKEAVDGMSLVAFESMYIGNAIIADHKDINDEGQTINYPKLGTTVVDDNSGTHTGTVDKEVTLTDTVKYDNLVVGKEYAIKGKLMDKETGKALLINGKEITQEYTFKPENKSGSVDLKFTLDSTGLRNKTTVVFEDLIYKGITVATHSDIKDEEQTIHFPNIRTNATDGLSGNHAGTLGKTTVVDNVTYENLVVGKEYTVSGTLMDKETGKEFLVDGKPVTATKTFTAETANGAVDLVYELDASALEGKTLVVFENLLVNGKKVVSHADITDEDQTVHYPKIRTTASDVDTKDEVGTVKDTTTLTDKVSYWNLVPGTAYTLKGAVYEKESQKAVSSEVTKEFTPTTADGSINLDFSFNSDSEGKDFVVFEDLYTNGKKIASHSNIEDKDQTIHYPKIRTTALDKNSVTHTGTIGKDVTIVDTVKYNNLVVGKEYTLSGKLMNKETGKPLTVNDKEITSMVTFTPDKKDGSIDLKFTLDSSALEDVTTVVYENLNYKKVTVTTHSDINDEEQTIHFPKIRTHAVDSTTGNHVGTVGKTKITDTVTYSNLLPGKEYTLKGTLMDKETGKPLLVNDKEVVATKTFVPTEAKGSVDLVYVVDASALEGKTVVVFEDLYINGKKVTSHADITDEDQSVHFPKIRTSAVDKTTGFDETLAKGEQTIVDTVSYWNLVVGEKYTVKGKLMDKSTGTALLVNGKEVTVEKEFTVDKVNGTINLEFTFDASSLEGKTTVVFEDLYNSGVKVTTHSDIKDEAQTIRFPKVNTNALDKDTQLDEGMAKKTVTVKDDVHYFNLKVGETYKVSGVLMDKDTGEKFLVNGKPVIAEKEFVAEKENGTVTLEFTFDGSALENKTLVVFEDLYHKGKHVGTHTDINDEDQTVRYPTIRTSAIDKETQFNESNADNDVTIVDTVSCWNLTEGNTYTIKGKLMDKSIGEPILVNGKEVIAEKTFVASRRDGEVDLEFKFDGTSLNGKSTVVFEDLFRDGKQLATHSDLNDNVQTTHLPKIATKAYDKDSQIDEAIAKKETTIIDEVSYENLTNGVEYTVKGTLMDKATGEPLLVNGEEVHAEKTFIAGTECTTEEPKDRVSGKVLLEFTFDSSALEGQDLVVFEEMFREGKEVAFHTDITDGNQTVKFPKLRTTAVDGETNLDEGLGGSSEQKVVDTVSYWNLKPGTTYKIKGILMDKETGKPFLAGENEDQEVTVEKEFTPETVDGTIDLEFVFDGIYTASRTVVAFEDLYKEDHHVATHTDINDEDQDVKYPDIRTHALDKENGLNESVADEEVTIVDTVSYTNLTVGNTYTITGKLMDKETGEPLLVDGQEVTASKEFTPEETEGSVDIEFTFNGSALKGKTTVAFETLTREDKVVGVHADINDGEQTVHFPEVSTTASDKESGTDEGVFGKESTIVDVVKYNNLSEGVEYTVKGTLMDKETGEALLVDGKEVTAEKTFIAGSENEGYVDGAMTYPPNRVSGEVTLEFTFDSSALAEKSVVVFERVYCQDKEVAVHTDIEDENQTITYPEVLTTASDKKTGTHEQEAAKKVTVVDVVKYKSLKVGKEYTVKGVLMDKETGKELLINEKPVESTATFTPEKPDGEVSLEFTFDSSALAGKTVVAFETLYREEIKVGVHADINDEDQSVHIISIGTKAQDVKSKSSTMTVDKEAKLKDIVSFKGLTVGKQYTLKGVVMDKATSKQVFVDGKKVEATTTFIPKESDGTADVVFTLNTTKLQGRSLVVFEELYDKDNVKVAEHKDLKDKDQTVSVPKVPNTPENPGGGSGFAKTGENIAFVLTGIICIIASFGLFGVAVRRRRRRA